MKDPGSRRRLSSWRGLLAWVLAASGSFDARPARADGELQYEVREQVAMALLPTHNYGVTGSCATGTGLAPASAYAQGGAGRGQGVGAGVGARVFYRDAPRPAPGSTSTWWGFRAGGGLDLDLLYAKVPVGIPDLSGQLCQSLKGGVEVQYANSSVLLVQVPAYAGGELGLGATDDTATWHGLVLGAAWAPTFTVMQPWNTGGDVSASYLGTELTLDFASIEATGARISSKRLAVMLVLPVREDGPLILTLSFGAVWR
jgi:hypothetical protein